MDRDPSSHKGDNGKVAIIGGSRFIHGAPLISALAAEASGVDTMSICLPQCHEEVAKSTTLNAFVHPFVEDDLSEKDTEPILELLATLDCAVMGPGLSREGPSIKAMKNIIASATCPLVLDATALQPDSIDLVGNKTAVFTPHLGELERMDLNIDDVRTKIHGTNIVFCIKGSTDHVIGSDGKKEEVIGGNAGLTVGGTGDALAGLIAGLIAQRMHPFQAAEIACGIIKKAGAELFGEKGYAFTAKDVIHEIPRLLHS